MVIEFYEFVIIAVIIRYIPILRVPFNMLATFIHELGHGLMAIITFGSIKKITLNFDGSGACTYTYKNALSHFAITLFGYISTALVGYYIYFIAKRDSSVITLENFYIILGFIALSITLWVRDFKTLFLVLSISLVFIVGIIDEFTDLFNISSYIILYIQFLGVYIMIDALIAPLHLIDGKDDGDGASLTSRTKIPEGFWILLWLGVASYALYRAYLL